MNSSHRTKVNKSLLSPEQESFLHKTWSLNQALVPKALTDSCPDSMLARILHERSVSFEEVNYYLSLESEKPSFSSPYEIPELEKAVLRIEKAVDQKEKIMIYGDYDVDGTTSSALMVYALRDLGANADFYIPHRIEEGYGLNPKAIIKIKSKQKAKLLITCDCGITNLEEIELANSIGLDVIVTDHHSLPKDLPKAVAVLNPKFLPENHPLHWLPGVGVAFKLAEALLKKKNFPQEKIDQLLDLVCLGMIADLAPLRSENRLLVQKGLKILQQTQKIGLKALLEESGNKTNEEGVGFSIAPRINAAGRLYDAKAAVELFLSESSTDSDRLAKALSKQNQERQELCELTFQQSLELVKNLNLEESWAIILEDQRWHHGVVGIVASRLVDKFNLPVFLGVFEGEKIKGSARGIEGLDLFYEMSKFSDLFDKFGGHKAAAGFSLSKKNWEVFREKFQTNLKDNFQKEDFVANLKIDQVLKTEDLDLQTVQRIEKLAPFGFGLAKPVFYCEKDFKILRIVPIGKKKRYPKFILESEGKVIEGLFWRAEYQEILEAWKAFNHSSFVKLAFTPERNFFRGESNLVLEIKDLAFVQEISLTSKVFLKKLVSICKKKFELKENLSLKDLVLQTKTNQEVCLEGLQILQKSGLITIKSKTQRTKKNFQRNFEFNQEVKKLVANTKKLKELLKQL